MGVGFWGRLFGTKEVINGIGGYIDDATFSPQEKARHALDYIKATSGYNLARRIIAIMWIAVSLLLIITTAVLIVLELPTADKMISFLVDFLLVPTGMVLTFYYGSGIAKRIKGK